MKPLCKLDIVPCNLIIMDLLNRCMCSFFSSVSHYHLFMMQYQCHKRLRIQQLSLTSSQVQGYFCAIWPRLSMKLGSLNLSSMQLLLLIAVLAIRNNYRMWYIVMLIFLPTIAAARLRRQVILIVYAIIPKPIIGPLSNWVETWVVLRSLVITSKA